MASCCTEESSNRRPINLFVANTVFYELVTACLLAAAPTNLSPSLVKATTEGVVLAPSAFSITLGVLPSINATQELVVPRSIPITSPVFLVAKKLCSREFLKTVLIIFTNQEFIIYTITQIKFLKLILIFTHIILNKHFQLLKKQKISNIFGIVLVYFRLECTIL